MYNIYGIFYSSSFKALSFVFSDIGLFMIFMVIIMLVFAADSVLSHGKASRHPQGRSEKGSSVSQSQLPA